MQWLQCWIQFVNATEIPLELDTGHVWETESMYISTL